MRRRKRYFSIIFIGIFLCILLLAGYGDFFLGNPSYFFRKPVHIAIVSFKADKNNNGIFDAYEIIAGARQEITNGTKYKSEYYIGGYPPSTEGVCTDVIWRALRNSGYELKSKIDLDIAEDPAAYSTVIKIPDPNIDFRRVKNQFIYFKRHAEALTIEVRPYNKANLYEWQLGDIVVLKNSDHVAIISDKRGRDGVPFIIHNASTYPMEQNKLMKWAKQGRIIGHFRIYN